MSESTVDRSIYVAKLSNGYLHQRYPYSSEGQLLRTQVQTAIDLKDSAALSGLVPHLPTVEDPKLHLFKDLNPLPEATFFDNLANIQVTKGCSHGCNFCAIDAGLKVESMPFIAVAKMGRELQDAAVKQLEVWEKIWQGLEASGFQKREDFYQEYLKNQERFKYSYNMDFRPYPFFSYNEDLWDLAKGWDDQAIHDLENMLPGILRRLGLPYVVGEMDTPDRLLYPGRNYLTNYYDSDPFDYRDPSVLHQDSATPADYGDAVHALATPVSPIYITTAGWNSKNIRVKEAADKINQMASIDPRRRSHFRLSVSNGELQAQRDRGSYLESMFEAAKALFGQENIPAYFNKVLFLFDKSDPSFEADVIRPLWQRLVDENVNCVADCYPSISYYSGRAVHLAGERTVANYYDVMNCMPGYHLWPDGTLHMQTPGRDHASKRPEVGSRPQPTGSSLYTLLR